MSQRQILLIADKTPRAQQIRAHVMQSSLCVEELHNEVSAIVVIGGDGMMIKAIHLHIDLGLPFYGIKAGGVGFLMNEWTGRNVQAAIDASRTAEFRPLAASITQSNGSVYTLLAINEISLLRQSSQTAHFEIYVDGELQLSHLISDGVLVATPTGSSAYNFSVGGPIVPIGSNLLALTPISPFRPRRWSGALLRDEVRIMVRVRDPLKRPVSATADSVEVRDASEVEIALSKDKWVKLLCSEDFGKRLIREQFFYEAQIDSANTIQ